MGYNAGPYAHDGGLSTVDVANPEDGYGLDFEPLVGAAARMVVAFDDAGPTMWFQLPGGTSLLREPAERYNQLAERWLRNEPIIFQWGDAAWSAPQVAMTIEPAP